MPVDDADRARLADLSAHLGLSAAAVVRLAVRRLHEAEAPPRARRRTLKAVAPPKLKSKPTRKPKGGKK